MCLKEGIRFFICRMNFGVNLSCIKYYTKNYTKSYISISEGETVGFGMMGTDKYSAVFPDGSKAVLLNLAGETGALYSSLNAIRKGRGAHHGPEWGKEPPGGRASEAHHQWIIHGSHWLLSFPLHLLPSLTVSFRGFFCCYFQFAFMRSSVCDIFRLIISVFGAKLHISSTKRTMHYRIIPINIIYIK